MRETEPTLPRGTTLALGGLMVSTFPTMVYVPVLYSFLDDRQDRIRRAWSGVASVPARERV